MESLISSVESVFSGGRGCAIVGVLWWGSVSACVAWGALFVFVENAFK